MIDAIMFYDCDYANDFEAFVDASEFFSWLPEEKFDFWFKAYDTSCRENDRDIALNDNGQMFDCYVWLVQHDDNHDGNKTIPPFLKCNTSAADKDDAVEILIDYAETINCNWGIESELVKLMDMVG